MTTTEAAPANSDRWEQTLDAKMTRYVEQARELGLVVTVTGKDDAVLSSRTVTIKRPQVEPVVTMLDVARNADSLSIYACRVFDSRWSHTAWSGSYSGTRKLSKLKLVPYYIEGMTR